MKYKILSPKYIYYIGIIMRIFIIVFLTFLFIEAIVADEYVATAIISVLTIGMVIWSASDSAKYIHAKLDLTNGVLVFGNIYFSNEVPIVDVRYDGKHLLSGKTLRVWIDGRKYYILTLDSGVELLFTGRK